MIVINSRLCDNFSKGLGLARYYQKILDTATAGDFQRAYEEIKREYDSQFAKWYSQKSVKDHKYKLAISRWEQAVWAWPLAVFILASLVAGIVASLLFILPLFLTTDPKEMQVFASLLMGWICAIPGLVVLFTLITSLIIFVRKPKPELHPACPEKIYDLSNESIVNSFFCSINHGFIESRTYGSDGEKLLLDALKRKLDDKYFALTNLLVAESSDADVIVLGPRGLWLLESKYWQGAVTFKGGKWEHHRTIYLPGGIPTQMECDDSPHPHIQVENTLRRIRTILKKELPQHNPSSLIRGVIVFTHPQIDMRLLDPPPVDVCCTPDEAVEKILNDDRPASLLPENLLRIVDALNNKAREYCLGYESQPAWIFVGNIFLRQYNLLLNFAKKHQLSLSKELRIPGQGDH